MMGVDFSSEEGLILFNWMWVSSLASSLKVVNDVDRGILLILRTTFFGLYFLEILREVLNLDLAALVTVDLFIKIFKIRMNTTHIMQVLQTNNGYLH